MPVLLLVRSLQTLLHESVGGAVQTHVGEVAGRFVVRVTQFLGSVSPVFHLDLVHILKNT